MNSKYNCKFFIKKSNLQNTPRDYFFGTL